jgi:hypothetical protein
MSQDHTLDELANKLNEEFDELKQDDRCEPEDDDEEREFQSVESLAIALQHTLLASPVLLST